MSGVHQGRYAFFSDSASPFYGVDKPPHLGLVDEPAVNFVSSCPRDHFANVVLTNSATGDYRDTLSRL